MATVREEAIKTVSESRTTLLTSRVRRQRYTTLLAPQTPPMASAIVVIVIGLRTVIIIPCDHHYPHLDRDCLVETRAHGPRRYLDTYMLWSSVIDDSSFLASLFLRENCDAGVAMKMMFMSDRYVIFFLFVPARTMTWSYVIEGILWMI